MRNTLIILALIAAAVIAGYLVMSASPDRDRALEFAAVSGFTVDGSVEGISASPDEQYLLHTNHARKTLDVVDIGNPAQPQRVGRISLPGKPTGVAVSPDGKWVLATLYLAHTESGEATPHPRAPGGLAIVDMTDPAQPRLSEIIGIGHQPGSVAVASSGADLVAIIAVTNAPLTVNEGNNSDTATDISQPGSVQVVSFNPTRQSNYRVGSLDLSEARLTEANLPNPGDAQPAFVTLSANSTQAAAALPANEGIDVFDPYWLETRRLFATPGQQPLAVAFSIDGSIIYSGAKPDNPAAGAYSLSAWTAEGEFVWGDNSLTTVNQIVVKKIGATDFAFALSSADKQILIYDVAVPGNPQKLQTIATQTAPRGIAVLPARSLGAVADDSGNITFYQRPVAAEPAAESAENVNK